MPKFIDAHPMNPLTAEQLRAAQMSPPDEFGVSHHDILYSEPENKIYCVLEARTKRQSRSTTRRSESAATGFVKWSPHATEAIRDLVERLAVVEGEFRRPDEVRENCDRRQTWLGGSD